MKKNTRDDLEIDHSSPASLQIKNAKPPKSLRAPEVWAAHGDFPPKSTILKGEKE